ncbi:GTP 3',8-cyclase MoaA [Undibacterium cyanobacteriorum]|uniref:GTP 3',8-cyclase n=1 Tax=Undibacterium cyanobacteriorum TaxID=3073561 RepID=A0ABY9RKI0_9BURK|nr:GTP 3',8-cyclase MoaA [Undibacterium sp. 20NA77.5]WMW81713.1 GTP 3',8-cyclase MoaA [Undibacterium sp. 20NA77.5]
MDTQTPIRNEARVLDRQQANLQDRFGRKIDYLRVSVTDKCDLRCSYCMPKGFRGFEEPENWLTFAEIERVVAAFGRLGVRRVRLTGGEPLLRRDLPRLVGALASHLELEDISLSTNATQLEKHAQALFDAGVRRINVSLDSLDRACVQKITGSDNLEQVMRGLRLAKEIGMRPIKLNMVVMRGVNDHEVSRMTAFCMREGFILRFIEAMPMGSTGQASAYCDLGPIREQLVREFDLIPVAKELGGGPARYWQARNGEGTIGFISPISQHFCASCNRVRLAVDGTLYMCLGQEAAFPLRPYLRQGVTDQALEQLLLQAIELKPERHEFNSKPHQVVRFMSQTGG